MPNEFLRNVTDLLKTTEDKFTKSLLCYIGYDDANKKEVPYFCGVGECLHAVGFTCKQINGNAILTDFNNDDDFGNNMYVDMQTKLFDRFKVDFTQQYKSHIECQFCIQDDIQPTPILNFESLINHINDSHTLGMPDAFGQIAEKLEEMAKYFDLQTGEYIFKE